VAAFVVSIRSYFLVFALLFANGALAQTAHFSQALAYPPGGKGSTPHGLAVDAKGNIFIADTVDYVYDIGAPWGVAVDASGTLYYTHELLNQVTKVSPVTGTSTLPLSGLNGPTGIAVDAHGNVFIADSENSRIVEATPVGDSYTQSVVPTRPLERPLAVAVDGSGNLYVADSGNFRVLKETWTGSGWNESIVVNLPSGYEEPTSIAADAQGDVYVLQTIDFDNNFQLSKETLSGGVYTQSVVPSYGQDPYAIATDPAGNLYMNSPFETQPSPGILEVLAGPTTTFLPLSVTATSSKVSLVFSFDASTTLSAPMVVTEGDVGLDFTNAGTGTCGSKKASFVYNPGDTCFVDVVFKPQLPGNRYGAAVLEGPSGNVLATAYVSGIGVGSQISFPPGKQVSIASGLQNPAGVAVDAAGNAFVAESSTGNVYREGASRTLVASGLSEPSAVALDGAGNVYVIASGAVYKEAPSHGGYVQTQIATDLTSLAGVAVDRGGNLYLTSLVAGNVHKETLQTNGSYVESGIGFGITSPRGVAVDGSGNVFMLSAGEVFIETLQPNGRYVQSTFSPGVAAAQYLAVDGHGNVYFSDASQGEIDKLTPQPNGSYVESVARAGLTMPSGVAVDGRGNLYCALGTGQLTMIDVSDAPSLVFPTTKPGTTSVVDQMIANVGNDTLVFPPLAAGTNAGLSGDPFFAFGTASTCPIVGVSGEASNLGAGGSCVYGISFTPPARGSFSGSLSLMDNNLNAAAEQDIALSGASTTSDATRTTLRVSPSPVGVGLGVTMIVTVADTANAATFPQGGVTFTDTVGSQVVSLNGGAPVVLSNGKATLTMDPSVAGVHTIAAHYGGVDASFLSSTGQASLTVQ
jgi:streptogramin lyase